MATKLCIFMLLLVTVCYGKVQNTQPTESNPENGLNTVEFKNITNSTVTPVLQLSYSDDNAPRGVVVAIPIVSLLLIACCIFFCCRCRSQRNQGVVMTVHPPPQQPPPTHIVIHQQQPPPMQQTIVPPPYPTQHVPPPYDTQPAPGWGQPPMQQQFHQQQQLPTSYANPNYGQPPVNMQYGQDKY